VCPHVVYTSLVGCVVGSNVEASGVSGYKHAYAVISLRACMLLIRVSLDVAPWRVGMPPNLCISTCCIHKCGGVCYWSNVEAPDVSYYTHTHAMTALRHACSGLWFLLMSHLGGWECTRNSCVSTCCVRKSGGVCCWIQC
jgi:hypothetical protein